MVESGKDKTFKSLSADSELQSGYEYLYKGDYKQCKRTIDKKFPKLKSDLDKFNFNVLKIQLLYRTKRYRDGKNLVNQVKKEAFNNSAISPDVINYFKNILIDLGDESSASEILKHNLKGVNLAKINKTEQMKLLKELCLNCEFSEMYSKVTGMLKNDQADVKFLTLMKYEMIYILVFRYQKLSKIIASTTLKEMLNNYEKYTDEKGFVDILVKYLISLNDQNSFLYLFEEKKVPFTNAPIDDLLVDIYHQRNDSLKLVNYLIRSILNNIDKCNFNTYQRLISYIIYYYKQSSLMELLDLDTFIQTDDEIAELIIQDLGDINNTFQNIKKFLNGIQIRRPNFNAYKSAIYSKLLLIHSIISAVGGYLKFADEIYELINSILKETHNKQSLLMEVKKYFIYLDKTTRNKLYTVYNYKDIISKEIITDDEKDKIVFGLKLKKLLIGKECNLDELLNYSKLLYDVYNKLTAGDIKLEKGERIIGDDIIILINERYHEYINHNGNDTSKEFIELSYNIYSINSLAHSKSPYNYDITVFLLKICGNLHMNNEVLEVLKFMNLKGPQFETVSYIAFPYFYYSQFKPGLIYLINNFERWEKENKRSIRKTLWKMFTGRNFWNCEELLAFMDENNQSYYKYIIKFFDLVSTLTENLLNPSSEENDKENFAELLDEMSSSYKIYEKDLNAGSIVHNQDLVISIFKFRYIDFFNNDYEMLKKNVNYNKNNFKYSIDALEKETIVYVEYPSYKNNYLIQKDVDVFGIFNNKQYLSKYVLNKVCFLPIYLDKLNSENYENYKSLNITYPTDHIGLLLNKLDYYDNTLYNLYTTYTSNIESLANHDDAIDKYYSNLKTEIIDILIGLRSDYLESAIFSYQKKQIFVNTFNLFSRYHLVNLTILTSKLLDLVSNNKKVLKDKAGTIKTTIMNIFKSPLLNFYNDNIELFNTNSQLNKLSETLAKCLVWSNKTNDNKEAIHKFVEEVKENNKEIKDNSRILKIYIKDNI
jgi:hypothetical protein